MQEQIYSKKLMAIVITITVVTLLLASLSIVFGAETNRINPEDNEYLELRTVELKDTGENGTQLIMQLWANNIAFKRI